MHEIWIRISVHVHLICRCANADPALVLWAFPSPLSCCGSRYHRLSFEDLAAIDSCSQTSCSTLVPQSHHIPVQVQDEVQVIRTGSSKGGKIGKAGYPMA